MGDVQHNAACSRRSNDQGRLRQQAENNSNRAADLAALKNRWSIEMNGMNHGRNITRIAFEETAHSGGTVESREGSQLQWYTCDIVGAWVNMIENGKVVRSFNPKYIQRIDWE